ncbi:MAG: hypothetical protein LUC35_04085 [Clostridiales bacterium]|nr:hypothetical protein [Clostridiales bacterium]
METKRKWNPEDELEGTDELMHSGAVPEETVYSLDDILREYGGEDDLPPAAEPVETPEPPAPEEDTAGQQEDAPPEDITPEDLATQHSEPESDALSDTPEAETAPEPEAAAQEDAEPSAPPEAPAGETDLTDTAAFIGQQVGEAIGLDEEPDEEESEPEEDTSGGLLQFFLDARRRTAQKRPHKKGAAADMEQAAAAMTATVEETRAEAESAKEAVENAKNGENVVEMPTPKAKFFRDSLGRIQDKAHDFADNMYADAEKAGDDSGGVPGTDEEEAPPEKKRSWRERRPRKEPPKAPDLSAEELASRYRLGLRFMRQRLYYTFALILVLLYLSIAEGCGFPLPAALLDHRVMSGVLTWGLALGTAIELDVLWMGLTAHWRGKPGLHTITALAVLATLLDGLVSALVGREGPLPFSAMALVSLFGAAWGAYDRKKALYLSCRVASNSSQPYRVTLDENQWDGISGFNREEGTVEGFGSQVQGMDGAQRIYRTWTPVLIVAAVVCAVVSSVGCGRPALLPWCLSTILVAAAPVSGLLAFGQPYLRLTRRLDRSGAVLAGWEGAASMRGKANILVKDEDLFPEGSVIMKSIKHSEGVSLEKLTGCTASMLRSADSGLYRLFDTELRRQGGFYRRVDNLECYEAGGLTADIRGEQVLIGTSGFLTVMNIRLENGMKLRRTVYCVINKKLAGFFSLDYEMSHYSKAAVRALVKGGVRPVLVTRDFNIIPSMLQTLHDLPVSQMEFPPIERRWELSEPGRPHNPVLGALLTREGMGSYSDAVLGGRRLCAVVRLNAWIAVLASLVGVVLSFYLTWSLAFASLTPLTMLGFLLLWAVPNLVISGAADQF